MIIFLQFCNFVNIKRLKVICDVIHGMFNIHVYTHSPRTRQPTRSCRTVPTNVAASE